MYALIYFLPVNFDPHLMHYFVCVVEAKHCPVTSDCRDLITKPLPACQSETILKLFDENFKSDIPECYCCYSCIKQHCLDGCKKCSELLVTFLPESSKKKVNKAVAADLKEALFDLFVALRMDLIFVENELTVKPSNFIKDFLKMLDKGSLKYNKNKK